MDAFADHVHLDAVGGAAGDMFVAAMLTAAPHLWPRVEADCRSVLPSGLGAALSEGMSAGLAVRRFGLVGGPQSAPDTASYPALAAVIEGARLSPGTAGQACAILRRLADAEAEVHGVPVERVHFHEIAGWDSLMDVVAAGSIAAAMKGARWSVSPLPVGGGLVKTMHGLLPVPAPATALLLRGFEMRDDGVGGERVTPTGAAILAHLVNAKAPSGRLAATGLGAGTRELAGLPNVLRALVFAPAAGVDADEVGVIAFEVDDMTGEEIAVAAEALRAAPGVLDLTLAVRHGKKGRPVTAVELLVRPGALADVARLCLTQTSTIGLRHRTERRMTLSRAADEAAGVRLKRVMRPDGRATTKAEHDDLAAPSLAERRENAQRAEAE